MSVGESSTCDGNSSNRINIIAVGDKGCGKTALNIAFVENSFPENGDLSKIPRQKLETVVRLEDESVPVLLWEFPIPPHILKDEVFTFESMDVVLLCFSHDIPGSFYNIGKYWLKQIIENNPHIPKVLVETKGDIKSHDVENDDLDTKSKETVSTLEILAFGEKIRAFEYVECSSKTGEGVPDVYRAAVEAVFARKCLSRDPSWEFTL